MHLSISASAIPFPVIVESPARPIGDALSLWCNQLELKCSHILLHSRLVPKSSQCVLERIWRLSAAKHAGTMPAIWPYCKIQAVFLLCAEGRSILGFTGKTYSVAGELMWGRSKENPHLYIWLCKEEILRMTRHNKKLQHARQQGQKTGKQASGRGPVGKNVALRKEKN